MMITKGVLVLLAILFCFPIVINAADNVTGQPFQNLQQQIVDLLFAHQIPFL